jgi:hypothetical protein
MSFKVENVLLNDIIDDFKVSNYAEENSHQFNIVFTPLDI